MELSFKVTKKIAPTWQRVASGFLASMTIILLILDMLGVNKKSLFNESMITIISVMAATYLFGYFAIRGYLPKYFQR